MLSDDELRRLLRDLEADNVERTAGIRDKDKFGQAICAFANDLPDRGATGVLLVGVHDDGSCAGLDIDERLMQTLAGFRSDGTITPFPVMHVMRRMIDGCAIAVVEVTPSDNPPLKYNGRVCVRIGPRRGYATAEEERRLTEKRRWGNLPFDQQPPASGISDPDRLAILRDYRSLMPLAQEARKPMFRLVPGDGAFGGHQAAVTQCRQDFQALTNRIMRACGLPLP